MGHVHPFINLILVLILLISTAISQYTFYDFLLHSNEEVDLAASIDMHYIQVRNSNASYFVSIHSPLDGYLRASHNRPGSSVWCLDLNEKGYVQHRKSLVIPKRAARMDCSLIMAVVPLVEGPRRDATASLFVRRKKFFRKYLNFNVWLGYLEESNEYGVVTMKIKPSSPRSITTPSLLEDDQKLKPILL